MDANINSLIILLLTQAMINLGEINDPVNNSKSINLDGAKVFIDLLEILKQKTKGNLTVEESKYLNSVLDNIQMVYLKKCS